MEPEEEPCGAAVREVFEEVRHFTSRAHSFTFTSCYSLSRRFLVIDVHIQ